MPVRIAGSMFYLIIFAIKSFCFLYVFFSYRLPKKCLGLFYWLMVTLLSRLYKMGCIFCFPKGSDDRFPKKNSFNQTISSSGKYTQHGKVRHNSGRRGSEMSRQLGKEASAAREIPTKPIISQNSTSRPYSDSPYNKRPQQFENVQRAAYDSLRMASQNLMTKDSILEGGGTSLSARTSLKLSGQGDSHDNTVVYEVNENKKRSYKKHEVASLHSLPAAHLDKSPVNYQENKRNQSGSYDASSYWNTRTGDGSAKSSPQVIQMFMPTTSIADPYCRNPYLYLNENKKKKILSNEGSVRATLTTSMEQQSPRPLISNVVDELYSEASSHSSNTNEHMEMDSSLKRAITSCDDQHLGLTESDLVDEYSSEIVNTPSKRFKETVPDKEPLTYETILAELECRLRQRHNENLTSPKVHRFYFELCTLEESGSVRKQFCSLPDLFPQTPQWRMLVYGKPFFGKTQLCHDVAVVWHTSSTDEFANIQDFKILIHHDLKPGSDMDLEKCLVDNCYNILTKNFVTKIEFKNAWSSGMFETIFILDGYDKLSNSEKDSVKLSLRQNFFNEASILLTCSPDADNELRHTFNIHVDICGFSRTMLFELTNYNSRYLSSFDDCKVDKLYGISSFYAQAVVNSFDEVDKPKSLYDLLNSVVNLLTTSTSLTDLTFELIGSSFLEGLKCRSFVFEEEKLRHLLNKSWHDLESFGLFVACPSKPNETRKLVVSHKLFMVYFSVRYLRGKWKKLKLAAQRDVFLKAQLCFEDSSGVYIGTSKEIPKQFFVGVIPEIVFDVHNDVFQMMQDVSEPDLTSAFETHSLLLRVDSKRLHVFGITEVENPDFQHFFEGILNILDFWGLVVNTKFYIDIDSPLYYLKIVAIEEGDTDRPVMMVVTSINPENSGRFQEIHLDFLQSDVKVLHSFLQKFGETVFGSCQIDPEMSAVDLVFHLVTVCLAFPCDMHTQLTIGSRSFSSSPLVTWEIMSSSCGKPMSSFTYLSANGIVLREFDSKACHNLMRGPNPSKVIGTMNKSISKFSELGITINVKSVL